jgi:methyltransferase (TIGR00027 family)
LDYSGVMSSVPAAPSRTSQAVAAWRATLPRPSSADGDSGAQAALCAGMTPVADPIMRAHLRARTAFFDFQVSAAVARGRGQVVVLGAGYDDRALRFRTSGVRFFEVDHPATQDDKRLRLEATGGDLSGLTLVAADFRVDDVGAALERAGHRADLPSLVLAEGLLVYLDVTAVVDLLGAVRARAGTGSHLAASLAVHPEGLDSAWVTDSANAARPGAAAEPWRTILSPSAHVALVERSGWTVFESAGDTAHDAEAPGRSLLVLARP